jgi:hypothetical protein
MSENEPSIIARIKGLANTLEDDDVVTDFIAKLVYMYVENIIKTEYTSQHRSDILVVIIEEIFEEIYMLYKENGIDTTQNISIYIED